MSSLHLTNSSLNLVDLGVFARLLTFKNARCGHNIATWRLSLYFLKVKRAYKLP